MKLGPDERGLVTVGEDGFRIWNAQTGEPSTEMLDLGETVEYVDYSDDGAWLLVAGRRRGQLIATRTGQPIGLPLRWGPQPQQVALVAGKSKLQVLERNAFGKVDLWDFSPTDAPLAQLELLAEVLSSRRVDEARSVVSLSREAFEMAWQALRASREGRTYPDIDAPMRAPGCG